MKSPQTEELLQGLMTMDDGFRRYTKRDLRPPRLLEPSIDGKMALLVKLLGISGTTELGGVQTVLQRHIE